MTVRRRGPQDVQPCVEVLAAVHGRDGYPLQWPLDPVSWLTPPDLLAAWVAHVEGELAGHVALTGNDLAERRPKVGQAEISRLFVSPNLRGRGVGAQLLDAASRQAEHHGWALWLEVVEVVEGDGTAAQFYERRGWRQVDRLRANWTTSAGYRPVVRRYVEPPLPETP